VKSLAPGFLRQLLREFQGGFVSQSNSTVGRLENISSSHPSNTAIAYAILRLAFGANILLHGLSRLLNGQPAFLAYLTKYFEHAHLIPSSMLPLFATVLPWVETILGVLLVLGLFSRFTLIIGALVLTVLVVGTNLAQDWLVAGLQLPYCFIYYYLLIHLEQNTLSLDTMFGMGGR
jgi:thiosulfate dehydrogenase [quinone] large subunit